MTSELQYTYLEFTYEKLNALAIKVARAFS
ncbi:hypothetical protein VCE7224_03701 [Vibrio celticus]|uniref:Uncharacterized protein n=1 Tax=Vibrio celticus TaxID=446372 RepID=A0A1C3JIL3_9VIBR|nr:hypothetical protein VCE7224_03701 [Vibrio celticus]